MNKELIKKYKAEFNHWLNGGELLYSYIDDKFLWKSMDEIDNNMYPVYIRKFTTTVSGWIRFDKDFVVSGGYYGFSRYFTYGLKIGGNFKYGNPRFMMNYVLKYISHTYGLPLYEKGEEPSIWKTDGTNWSAIGIGY